MRHRIGVLAIALVAAFAFAACGGDPEVGGPVAAPAGGAGTPVATTTPGTGAPATAGASTGTPTGEPAAGEAAPGDSGDIAGLGSLDGMGSVYEPKAQFGEEVDDGSSDDPRTDMVEESTVDDSSQPAPKVTYGPAKIELDGKVHTVAAGGVFPKSTRQFKVLSIGLDSVTVVLSAGEFGDGSDGITLTKGKPVSLVNQSEGLTYVLRLITVAKGTGTTAGTTSDSGTDLGSSAAQPGTGLATFPVM